MADSFSLDDALSGQQSQGQNLNNPWGGQNPGQPGAPGGQQYPGFPGPGGQQYPGFPGPGGQQYPGFPGPGGQQYPGYPGPGGPQYPGAPQGGPQYPGAPQGGQQYPGAPQGGQQYPGFPGYPGAPATAGQTFPGQPGAIPSAPTGPLRVPYDLPLPNGLVPRLVISFQVSIAPNAKRFSIDLRKGRDVVFHFNPRFDENPNVVVRNSMIREEWGREERQGQFPFKQGQQFNIQIFFEQDKFNVTVNNANICQYQHRVRDFSEIKSVSINGDITLNGATATVV